MTNDVPIRKEGVCNFFDAVEAKKFSYTLFLILRNLKYIVMKDFGEIFFCVSKVVAVTDKWQCFYLFI